MWYASMGIIGAMIALAKRVKINFNYSTTYKTGTEIDYDIR